MRFHFLTRGGQQENHKKSFTPQSIDQSLRYLFPIYHVYEEKNPHTVIIPPKILWRAFFPPFGAFNFPGRKKQKFNARCVCFYACMCVFPAGTFGGAYFLLSSLSAGGWAVWGGNGWRSHIDFSSRLPLSFLPHSPPPPRLKVEELLMDFSIFHIKIDGISFLRNCVCWSSAEQVCVQIEMNTF